MSTPEQRVERGRRLILAGSPAEAQEGLAERLDALIEAARAAGRAQCACATERLADAEGSPHP